MDNTIPISASDIFCREEFITISDASFKLLFNIISYGLINKTDRIPQYPEQSGVIFRMNEDTCNDCLNELIRYGFLTEASFRNGYPEEYLITHLEKWWD